MIIKNDSFSIKMITFYLTGHFWSAPLRPQENPYRNNIDSSKLIYIKLTRGSLFWSLDYTYKPIITGDMNELFNN